MKGAAGRSFGTLALFLILGAVLGGVIGELFASTSMGGLAPYLIRTFPVFDLPPTTINLYIVKFIFGLSLHPNLISLLGVIVAYMLFRRF